MDILCGLYGVILPKKHWPDIFLIISPSFCKQIMHILYFIYFEHIVASYVCCSMDNSVQLLYFEKFWP